MFKKLLLLLIFILVLFTIFLVYKYNLNNYKSTESVNNSINITDKSYITPLKISDQLLSVELANTNEKRNSGLSGRDSIEFNQGMLFDFGYYDHTPTFWMKDMIMPIDIIWINDNLVVDITKNVPIEVNVDDDNLKRYKPNTKIDYVLEVKEGFADKFNLKVGDSVSF